MESTSLGSEVRGAGRKQGRLVPWPAVARRRRGEGTGEPAGTSVSSRRAWARPRQRESAEVTERGHGLRLNEASVGWGRGLPPAAVAFLSRAGGTRGSGRRGTPGSDTTSRVCPRPLQPRRRREEEPENTDGSVRSEVTPRLLPGLAGSRGSRPASTPPSRGSESSMPIISTTSGPGASPADRAVVCAEGPQGEGDGPASGRSGLPCVLPGRPSASPRGGFLGLLCEQSPHVPSQAQAPAFCLQGERGLLAPGGRLRRWPQPSHSIGRP